MKLVITPRGFSSYGLEEIVVLEKAGFTVDYNDTGRAYSKEELLKKSQDADALIVGVDDIDRSFLEACPRLKIICKFGVGIDNIDTDFCKEKGIVVERTLGTNTNAVAEHVAALMFLDAKNLYRNIAEVRDGFWNKPTGYEISGKVLGIVGYGAIGKRLAEIALSLGMKVLVQDILPIKENELKKSAVNEASFEEILLHADYLSLHLPLVDETKNMFSQTAFEKMKKSACLINTARGGIVDEEALYEALIQGKIRSACFDVFSKEPPQRGDKLVTLDNFYLTSHIGARTEEAEKRTCNLSAEKIINHFQ